MEPTDASTTAPVPPPARNPAVETGRQDYFKKPLARYGFELVVIVLGISLSFAVENWRQDREEAKTQRKVLIALGDDLENLAGEIQSDSIGIAAVIQFLLQLEQGETLTQQEMDEGMTLLWAAQYASLNPSLASHESATNTKAWIEMPDTLRYNLIEITRLLGYYLSNTYRITFSDYAENITNTDLGSCLEKSVPRANSPAYTVDVACLRQKLQNPTTRAILRVLRLRLQTVIVQISGDRKRITAQLKELRSYLKVSNSDRGSAQSRKLLEELMGK